MKSKLFSNLKIREVNIPNRIALSPLCMYSAKNGLPNDWHFAHLSTFARAKVGLIFAEATAIEEIGRITPFCLGLWNDDQVNAFKPITKFIKNMGCVPAFQLAHAGRKGSANPPWEGGTPLVETNNKDGIGSWQTVAPSPLPLAEGWNAPKELDKYDIKLLIKSYVNCALRALRAGFEVLEIHAAHGYLLHSFLSPISNRRDDEFGGDIEGRSKLLIKIVKEIRNHIPEGVPLFCRISSIDGVEGGWSLKDSVYLSTLLADAGIDVIDCSSGGIIGRPRFAVDDMGKELSKNSSRGYGFQVPYSNEIKTKTTLKTMAVGVIVDPKQAEEILVDNKADIVALGRELMYNPFWPLHAAQELKADANFELWPKQYKWGISRRDELFKFKR